MRQAAHFPIWQEGDAASRARRGQQSSASSGGAPVGNSVKEAEDKDRVLVLSSVPDNERFCFGGAHPGRSMQFAGRLI